METTETIGIIVSPNPKAWVLTAELLSVINGQIIDVPFQNSFISTSRLAQYGHINQFIAVGGDGACLRALRIAYEIGKLSLCNKAPMVFGLNCGHIGALSNQIGCIVDIPKRLKNAVHQVINPLEVTSSFRNKISHYTFFNEVILKPFANLTRLKINWQDKEQHHKEIRGGLMIATKLGEQAVNACNYTGPEAILPIPDESSWRMSTVQAMSNDLTCDKAFQAIVPSESTVSVEVVNPYQDRNAYLVGDSYYHETESVLTDETDQPIGANAGVLFVEKVIVSSAQQPVLLAKDRQRV
ncbi:MAG: hypothetical protein E7014_00285 [Alphaproteobacteria bacterium]|nr:hypothetical protein [Alphaproteobacteria bacterium]